MSQVSALSFSPARVENVGVLPEGGVERGSLTERHRPFPTGMMAAARLSAHQGSCPSSTCASDGQDRRLPAKAAAGTYIWHQAARAAQTQFPSVRELSDVVLDRAAMLTEEVPLQPVGQREGFDLCVHGPWLKVEPDVNTTQVLEGRGVALQLPQGEVKGPDLFCQAAHRMDVKVFWQLESWGVSHHEVQDSLSFAQEVRVALVFGAA